MRSARLGQQLVARAHRVEDHVAVDQQVLAAVVAHAHRVGEHLQRVDLRQVVDAADRALARRLGHAALDHRLGHRGEGGADLHHRLRAEDARQHRARLRVQRRVGFQDQALRPERRFEVEVAQAHAGAGDEGGVVVEHRVHLLMARAGHHAGVRRRAAPPARLRAGAGASGRGRSGFRPRRGRCPVRGGSAVSFIVRPSVLMLQCTAMPTSRSSVAVSWRSSCGGRGVHHRAALQHQRAVGVAQRFLHLLLDDHDRDARARGSCA